MIKVVAFDFGGVMGSESDDFENTFKKISELSGLTTERLHSIFDNHWPKLKIGKESTKNFWKDVLRESSKHIAGNDLEKEYESNIFIDKEMLKIVDEVKKKNYRIVLLPNETKEWIDYKIKRFQLNMIFDKIYCSAYLAIGKPNKEIFEYVLKDLMIKPEELLFIDNQENNIEVARSLGINSILYTNSQKAKGEIMRSLSI